MKRPPLLYGLIGLLTGSAATALILWLTVQPFSKVSQASPQPSPASPSPTVPGLGGMMGQPDQHFIVMMIPHHEGAIAMADLALQRSQRPEIRTLAASIKTTQSREIEEMRNWYQQWYGTEVPAWGPGNRWGWYNRNQNSTNQQPIWGPGMGQYRNWNDWDRQGGGGMMQGGMMQGGMMGNGWSGTNLYALQNASDFDRAFIEEMIPHHQMGVMMASMVLNSTQRPEIRSLAQAIIKNQTDEINQMQQWYQQWYP